jgi:hypothetical protein
MERNLTDTNTEFEKALLQIEVIGAEFISVEIE